MDDFEAFAAANWAGLVRAAYLMGSSSTDAEDHAQTALTVMWRKWSRVQAAEVPDAYAYRILINTVHKARRRRWTGERPTGDLANPDYSHPSTEDPEAALDLRRALLTLPHDQRAVLVLRYLLDKSEADIADILDVPAGTVKSRSARGIEALRAQLNSELPT
jgi:RNA polymerase sigma-70 factor (sigma-E family)